MKPEILLQLIHDLTARALEAEARVEALEQQLAQAARRQQATPDVT